MNRIEYLRKKANLSQAKLAEKLNVHQTAVSQWEKGRTYPDMSMIIKIADYFGVSVDYLLGLEKSNNDISISDINNNQGVIVGHSNAPVNGNNEITLTKQEKDLLRIYNSISGEKQTELMQFAYKIDKEVK